MDFDYDDDGENEETASEDVGDFQDSTVGDEFERTAVEHVEDDEIDDRKDSYSILTESDIKERIEDCIAKVSTVLSVSRDASCMLLRHFNWSVSRVHEEWFSDEDGVKKAIGLLDDPVIPLPSAENLGCGICFESFCCDELKSAACGHLFCSECWTGYISTSIRDGPGCLLLRCPVPSCIAFVGSEMVNYFASHEDKEKYSHYLCRSYIEDNKKTKWCPAPGCQYAVDFSGFNENYDIYCLCTHGFCWKCTEDAHRPVDCETVAKWALKNISESENSNWILVHSKPCPKCKRPIEKNQGCMHMTCRSPCNHSFCWLCLRDWKNHGGRIYTCNRYEEAIQKGTLDDGERIRESARNMLQRYSHHYERWGSNQQSMKKALSDLKRVKNVVIVKLSRKVAQPESQLKFIVEAWKQIVKCRRVLKWTYAYGYYLPEDEPAKRTFFEYMQGQAESNLERLHHCAEKELEEFLFDERTSEEYNCFREKLSTLTRVTKDYFENLVNYLEGGLSDVEIKATISNSDVDETNQIVKRIRSE